MNEIKTTLFCTVHSFLLMTLICAGMYSGTALASSLTDQNTIQIAQSDDKKPKPTEEEEEEEANDEDDC